jgi:hypothetical protein
VTTCCDVVLRSTSSDKFFKLNFPFQDFIFHVCYADWHEWRQVVQRGRDTRVLLWQDSTKDILFEVYPSIFYGHTEEMKLNSEIRLFTLEGMGIMGHCLYCLCEFCWAVHFTSAVGNKLVLTAGIHVTEHWAWVSLLVTFTVGWISTTVTMHILYVKVKKEIICLSFICK